jgi:hypothetical protein
MYRLLSIAENFVQSELNKSGSEIVSLRLNCELLKKGTLTSDGIQNPESLGLYWVGWGTEASYNSPLDQEARSSEKSPDTNLSHEELDQLTSRIYEVLLTQASQDLKGKADIVAFLDIDVILPESTIIETRLRLPRNFRSHRLEENVPRRFHFYSERPCCATNSSYARNASDGCNYQKNC